METHKPYEDTQKRSCDFIVNYRFLNQEEGGRQEGTPGQGYRSDFMYLGDTADSIYAIWPEFLDEHGEVILDKTNRVAQTGKAKMWIVNQAFFDYHQNRITVGTKGYFMEGPNKTAECEVIERVRLK